MPNQTELRIGTITKLQQSPNPGELISEGTTYLFLSHENWQIGDKVIFEAVVLIYKGEAKEFAYNLKTLPPGVTDPNNIDDVVSDEDDEHPKHGTITDPPPGVFSASGCNPLWINHSLHCSASGSYPTGTYVYFHTGGYTQISTPNGNSAFAPVITEISNQPH